MTQGARSLYVRLLRLHHLRLSALVTFALFEGSIGVSVLLALAEIVSWWGLLAIPLTVALMVKLNDIVAGSLVRPFALAHLATPRIAGGLIVGRSPVPRASRITAEIGADDAVADPAATAPTPPTVRGRASSIARGVAVVPEPQQRRRPSPSAADPEPSVGPPTADSAEFGAASSRPDPAVRRSRGNKGRFSD